VPLAEASERIIGGNNFKDMVVVLDRLKGRVALYLVDFFV
jgi:hypothetical protein